MARYFFRASPGAKVFRTFDLYMGGLHGCQVVTSESNQEPGDLFVGQALLHVQSRSDEWKGPCFPDHSKVAVVDDAIV